jgi:hypothetical protein
MTRVVLTSIQPDQSAVLDEAVRRWREQEPERLRTRALVAGALDAEGDGRDDVYAFAYWLIRHSGLVRPDPVAVAEAAVREPVTRRRAREGPVTGHNLRCSFCGSYGASWVADPPEGGSLRGSATPLCPVHREIVLSAIDAGRRTEEELRRPRFQQDPSCPECGHHPRPSGGDCENRRCPSNRRRRPADPR